MLSVSELHDAAGAASRHADPEDRLESARELMARLQIRAYTTIVDTADPAAGRHRLAKSRCAGCHRTGHKRKRRRSERRHPAVPADEMHRTLKSSMSGSGFEPLANSCTVTASAVFPSSSRTSSWALSRTAALPISRWRSVSSSRPRTRNRRKSTLPPPVLPAAWQRGIMATNSYHAVP